MVVVDGRADDADMLPLMDMLPIEAERETDEATDEAEVVTEPIAGWSAEVCVLRGAQAEADDTIEAAAEVAEATAPLEAPVTDAHWAWAAVAALHASVGTEASLDARDQVRAGAGSGNASCHGRNEGGLQGSASGKTFGRCTLRHKQLASVADD